MKELLLKIKNSVRSAWQFLIDTRKELKNVSWPPRRELTGTTLVVIIAVFFFGFFLFVVDVIVKAGMDSVFRHLSR